ncbi:FtsW/RodA/SpoVE family cell cycle protein [Solwaraspora sp. WMMD937]|nr:FtsW/RodA/SpoVE family cell cycle protein [Solwaraspora sp. WMMD937]WFE21011.1 FtsW/RodA/SpoVE family cell cycle protein [Solwaraspora sp. WMMD937]
MSADPGRPVTDRPVTAADRSVPDRPAADRSVPDRHGPAARLDPIGGLAALRGLLARPLASYYLLIFSSGLLLMIGLTMVFSATSIKAYIDDGSAFSVLSRQATFAVIGLVAFWICQRLPAATFRTLGIVVLGAAVALLLLLNGLLLVSTLAGWQAARVGPVEAELLWLYFGSFQLQPSELAKLGLVLWGADVIARKGAELGHWRELAIPLFPAVGLLFLLVGYNDLGTMLCILALVVGLLWAAGVPLRIFATLGAVGLVGIGLLIAAAWQGAGSGAQDADNYRLARLTSFFTPPDQCVDDCYQALQARYAIANGGWFGEGLGSSRLKWGYLPQAEDDFIFAIVAEELGVVGCVVVLALFAVLAYTALRIARRVDDPFRRLAAAAAASWLISQAVINISGVIGLLPITGIPLPFISAGGSALVVTLAAIGMLASFARAEPDAARALNARPPARWVRLVWAPLPPMPRQRHPAKPRMTGVGPRRAGAGQPDGRGTSRSGSQSGSVPPRVPRRRDGR